MLPDWVELRWFLVAPWGQGIDLGTDVKRDDLPDEVVTLGDLLSVTAPCGFVATCYHGGTGWQGAMAWDRNGDAAAQRTTRDTWTSDGPAGSSVQCAASWRCGNNPDFDGYSDR